jgi:hypothetical protein
MSVVSLLGVEVKNNPAQFDAPYEFEITFECLEQLQKDLEWKLTYVGSATSNEYDQELDSVLVGPLPVGVNKFLFRADPPDLSRIPNSEIIGVTVILLSCSYEDREFVRVGYYVNNEYVDEALALEPPAKPVIEKVQRQILAEKPRVTRFAIKWYVAFHAEPNKRLSCLTCACAGTLRSLPHLSFLPSSLRPISTQMATSTALRRRKRRKRRPRAPLWRAKMLEWLAARRLQAPQSRRRRASPMAARTLTSKTLKARRRTRRRVVTTTWRWTRANQAAPTANQPSNSLGMHNSTARTSWFTRHVQLMGKRCFACS